MSWQDFEVKCTSYLISQYGIPNKINFIHTGGSDSTVSDIRVDIDGTSKFYIEVKMNASQCGQFVLLPDIKNKRFIFSEKNNSTKTSTTKKIIEYMNKNFEKYANGGILEVNDKVFYDWVIEHYKEMGTKYIITGDESKYIIFPIDKFSAYFSIKGVYRAKRSGSRSPSRNQQKQFIELIKNTKINFSYIINDDNDLIVRGNGLRRGNRFDINNNTYWLAEHRDGLRVRILSKTANSNVIFSIFLQKHTQDVSDLNAFMADLR